MTQRVTVCCTGNGRHGRIAFEKLVVGGDSVTALPVRRGRSHLPEGEPVFAEGETFTGELTPFAKSFATKRQPSGGWRWKLPFVRNRQAAE